MRIFKSVYKEILEHKYYTQAVTGKLALILQKSMCVCVCVCVCVFFCKETAKIHVHEK